MRADMLRTNYKDCLTRVVQECAEVIQVITKMQLHGEYPTYEGVTYNNPHDLLSEFNDLEHAILAITNHHKKDDQYLIKNNRFSANHKRGGEVDDLPNMLDALRYRCGGLIVSIPDPTTRSLDLSGILSWMEGVTNVIVRLRSYFNARGIVVPMPDIAVIVIDS